MLCQANKINFSTLDSGITVAPLLKNFHITILTLILHQSRHCGHLKKNLQIFSKTNKRTPMFIPESRVIGHYFLADVSLG